MNLVNCPQCHSNLFNTINGVIVCVECKLPVYTFKIPDSTPVTVSLFYVSEKQSKAADRKRRIKTAILHLLAVLIIAVYFPFLLLIAGVGLFYALFSGKDITGTRPILWFLGPILWASEIPGLRVRNKKQDELTGSEN